MAKRVIAGILIVVALLVVPRQVWLSGLKHRMQAVHDRQLQGGCNIPCMDGLIVQMKQINYELEHPPWYVVGGVGSISLDK